MREQQESILRQLQELEKDQALLSTPNPDEAAAKLNNLTTQQASQEKVILHLKQSLQTIQQEKLNLAQTHQETQTAYQDMNNQTQALKLNAENFHVRTSTIREQLNLEIAEIEIILSNLSADVTESAWQEKLGQLEKRIQSLGAINLLAIEEYQAELARKVYLDEQNDDLTQALASLQEAIIKIDKRKTKNAISNHF